MDEASPFDRSRYVDADDVRMSYGDYRPSAPRPYLAVGSNVVFPKQVFERGVFSPIFEDLSPDPVRGVDPASSPIGPATPFADYVDRAVTAAQLRTSFDHSRIVEVRQRPQYGSHDDYSDVPCYQCQTHQQAEQPVQHVPAPEPIVTPTATVAYKKLAGPLSEWIVGYVWKVCTTGMSLQPNYAEPLIRQALFQHAADSSCEFDSLDASLHPFTAICHLPGLVVIVRLPVFFGPVGLGATHAKEIRFRAELLGEAHLNLDRDSIESYAPFRLILLGCMLANKCWMITLSLTKLGIQYRNVPVRSLNKLESLTLDLFSYDLSISPEVWSGWLSNLTSLVSPSCHTCEGCATAPPEPVFVGLEEPSRDSHERVQTYEDSIDVLEIDLDEDGPLREEYLPRRRVSGAGSTRRTPGRDKRAEVERTLPPPAKWSPAADEPIIPTRGRGHVQYVAPQPISHIAVQALPPPPSFHPVVDSRHQSWSLGAYTARQEPVARHEYAAPIFHPSTAMAGYDYAYPAPQNSHSRSQSLSYHQAIGGESQGRSRSYTQSIDQGYSDVRLSESHFLPPLPTTSQWAAFDRPTSYPTSYDHPFDFHQRLPLKV
ncbi:hypothetical protein A0H81_09925 [Grifola frondosa]|uniref:Uncharacterized protein n=1 Tax=Grifola frondosa TaxID=5627 RepID=A0A1C7M510_GRIFR|nr:hypothetical protein A0H81_09925 [Grifola frondosa]